MNRILAIEPDADCGARLEQLVLREKPAHGAWILAASAGAAIAAMTDHRPDVILTSTILAANDEQGV